jgi:TPR repeat protein
MRKRKMAQSRMFAAKTREVYNNDLIIALNIYNNMMRDGSKYSHRYKLSNFKKAKLYFSKALLSNELQPKEAGDAFNRIGVIYMRGLAEDAPNYGYAKDCFEKAIKLGDTSAKDNLEALRKIIESTPVTIGEIINTPGVF